MIKRVLCALLFPFATSAVAEGFLLGLPIDCDLDADRCYIQQYMDHDPGPGVADYRCEGLSYDGHKGTDFGLPSLRDMAEGVPVIASAPGTVAGLRDGMPDTGYTPETAAEIENRECGNGVVLRHDDGWETQYCHLRQGSIVVTRGQDVAKGDVLGLVGQSGRAAFPHVHLSVHKDGEKIDPFDPDGTQTCASSSSDRTLWATPPRYEPGGLIDIGFATTIPDYSAVKAGTADTDMLMADAPALVVFGFVFGVRKGDVLRLTLTGPSGTVITQDHRFDRKQAQSFRAIGKRRGAAHWPSGRYIGTARLLRDGSIISDLTEDRTMR